MNARVKTVEELIDEIKEIIQGLREYENYRAEFSELNNTLYLYDSDDFSDDFDARPVKIFDIGAMAEEALQYYTETGNGEAEIKYDGEKFFTVEVLK